MNVDSNYTHKFFTVYSGYRPAEELSPMQFSVELTQPLLDIKEVKLEYVTFANNIAPLEGLSFSWSEINYISPTTTFIFPSYFMSPAQLMAYIQNQMNTLSPNGYTYTVTIDAVTGLINFTSTGLFSLDLEGTLTSGYNLGMNQLSDGRNLYPGVPKHRSPLGNIFTTPWPIFNREWGLALHIRPWTSDCCSNDTYLDNHQFVIPLSSTDYGGIVELKHLDSFKQNIAFFSPGHSFKRLFITVSKWIDSYNHITPNVNLNSEILLRFSYTTYRDTQALEESLKLKA